MKDLYRILGVERTADIKALRSAYLGLMKRIHPDRSGLNAGSEARVRDVNLAFSVLRDEVRRARYDLDLAADEQALENRREAARRRSRALIVQSHRAQTKGARTGRVLLALAVLGCLVIFYDEETRSLSPSAALDLGWGEAIADDPATAAPVSVPPLNPRMVADAVADYEWISSSSGMIGLNTHAGQCWAAMRRRPSFNLLSRCAAFDVAADIYVSGVGGRMNRSGTAYFGRMEREDRYRTGLALLAKGADPIPSLSLIEGATIASMVDRLGERSDQAGDGGSPPAEL